MDPHYYEQQDFVGHFEQAQRDAKALLKRIGAWDEYGRTGWGTSGGDAIFAEKSNPEMIQASEITKMYPRYYKGDKEKIADNFHRQDYENAYLGLNHQKHKLGWVRLV